MAANCEVDLEEIVDGNIDGSVDVDVCHAVANCVALMWCEVVSNC